MRVWGIPARDSASLMIMPAMLAPMTTGAVGSRVEPEF
jgi:hypothetical protein